MDMKKFCVSELQEFARILKEQPAGWQEKIKAWFNQVIFADSYSQAVKYSSSSDSAEPMDTDAIERLANIYYGTACNEIKAGIGQVKGSLWRGFTQICDEYEIRRFEVERFGSRGKGFIFRHWQAWFLIFQEYRKSDYEVSLIELAEIACSLYISSRLGSIDEAKEYFFG